MAKQTVNIGTTPNDNTGDSLRVGIDKVNDNFNEIYGVSGPIKSNGSDTVSAATLADFTQNNWKVFYSNGSGVITELALGADGTYLRSNGASSAPTFDTPEGSASAANAISYTVAEQSFTATASQTNFTCTNTPVFAWVWVNGAAQDASTWSISGDDIVLSTASTVNDAVEVYYMYEDSTLIYETFGIVCSDLTSDLTTGEKSAFDIPFNFTATRVYATVKTAPTGSALTIDVEDEGTTILNAVVSISASAYNGETSTFTGSASSYAFTKGDLISVDIDQIGSTVAGSGLIVFIEGYRT